MRFKTIIVLLILIIAGFAIYYIDKAVTGYAGERSPLPLPSTLSLDAYEKELYAFLDSREYETLDWKRDKGVRNTGPFIDDVSYGTHPAVTIYYSPEVYHWLKKGRKGEIPDGAMIVKVMYAAPAQRYNLLTKKEINKLEEDQTSEYFEGWTVMIKDKSGSKDGWFWSYYGHGQEVDHLKKYPFNYPNSGFGNYCIRCHASAENEFTFSSLRNIEGEEGDPISFYVDESWRDDKKGQAHLNDHERLAEGTSTKKQTSPTPLYTDSAFIKTFSGYTPVSKDQVIRFPPETYDHVVSGPDGPGQFITSDQCLSCHDGQSGNFLPNMLAGNPHSDTAKNISPYGEWRWSMMGLAGRDPIFYAQLESEKAIHNQANLANEVQNLCFSCHGVMGQRTFHDDYHSQPDSLFKEEHIYNYAYDTPKGKYGALAREGISCMSCHQIIDDGKSLKEIETGKFVTSPPGEVHGPFKNPPTHPMNEGLGLIPKYSKYVKSSRLCGSCHTIHLPVYNDKGVKVGMHYEQATYLEWLNSSFQNEYTPKGSNVQTCQDCHMPNKYPIGEGKELNYKIANVQDQDYPEADHLTTLDSITLENRNDFKRHTLLGINIYGLEMFNQFDDILGVRKTDYMTGLSNGLPNAIKNSDRLAKSHSVDLEIPEVSYSNGKLNAKLLLTNLTGHRFPSGVGFRRAFIQLAVLNAKGDTVWASGRANSVGVIVDQNGIPLPSEFLERDAMGVQQYEPHYTKITKQDQVQIYQELTKNPQGEFTTSFVSIAEVTKDNRLLPKGWSLRGPAGFDPAFAEATSPHGQSLKDKLYMSGTGQDEILYEIAIPKSTVKGGKIVAVVYYQAIPPFYLKQRFETAKGKDGKRLFYISSHLKTEGTPVEGWKLATGVAEKAIQ